MRIELIQKQSKNDHKEKQGSIENQNKIRKTDKKKKPPSENGSNDSNLRGQKVLSKKIVYESPQQKKAEYRDEADKPKSVTASGDGCSLNILATYNKLASLIRVDNNMEAIRFLRSCNDELKSSVLNLGAPDVRRPIVQLAVNSDSTVLLELLLRTYEVDPDIPGTIDDNAPCTAAWLAVKCNRRKAMAMLLQSGASVTVRCGQKRTTLLEEAMTLGPAGIPLMKYLIQRTQSINDADCHGVTPLMDATARGLTLFCIWLMIKGANINQRDNNGRTALHYSLIPSRDQPTAALQVLIANGGDPLIKDIYGCDVVLAASIGGNRKLLEKTIEIVQPPVDKIILAYELAGATRPSCLRWWPKTEIFFDSTRIDFWKTALDIANKHNEINSNSPKQPGSETSGSVKDFMTQESLTEMEQRKLGYEVEMQACIIIERIFGVHHPFVIAPLSNLQAFFASVNDLREIDISTRLIRIKDNQQQQKQQQIDRDDEDVVWEFRALCERLCYLSRSLGVTDTVKLISSIKQAAILGVDKVGNRAGCDTLKISLASSLVAMIISINDSSTYGCQDDSSLTLCLTELQLEYLHLLCTAIRVTPDGESRSDFVRITQLGVQQAKVRFSTLLPMAVRQTVARACCGNVQNDAMLLTVVRLLLRSGVDINARDSQGRTATEFLQWAVNRRQTTVGKECLQAIMALLRAFHTEINHSQTLPG